MSNAIEKEKVAIYIDGFNFYYGLRESLPEPYKWLDWMLLANKLIHKQKQQVKSVKYFTARITGDDDKRRRQSTYLEALRARGVALYFGQFERGSRKCPKCGQRYKVYNEKGTDVNIATQVIVDAIGNQFDVAFIVSGDSDLVSMIKTARSTFPEKKIIVAFPPKRVLRELIQLSAQYVHIGLESIRQSRLPEEVISESGYTLTCPQSWKWSEDPQTDLGTDGFRAL